MERSIATASLAVFALASIASATVRCGGSPSAASLDAGHGCVPGASVACAGPGGCDGFQVCKADGSGLAGCQCGGPGNTGMLDATVGAVDGAPGSGGDGAPGTGDGGHASACKNGGSTTISGKVYDPGSLNPLYNVAVYVPGVTPLPPLAASEPCGSCSTLYASPRASAVTAADGTFTVPNAPSGANVPLVVQVGKWRMLHTITNVTACQDNPQPDKSLRLPKNHTEGDIPNIAISTGGADTLECLFVRMGLDPLEYEPGGRGPGRIHIFAGGSATSLLGTGIGPPNTSPAGPASSAGLWNSDMDIAAFDLVMLSCEGSETANMNQQVLFDYAKGGGRVFASHFHYAWLNTGPFAAAANLATWTPGAGTVGSGAIDAVIEGTEVDGGSFPQGQALQQWLKGAGALGVGGAPAGELPIVSVRHNANLSAANTLSTSWIVPDTAAGLSAGTSLYFSFDTPLDTPPGSQCGRVVYSDMHLTGGAGADAGADYASVATVPGGCAMRALTPQELALEFAMFDLSSCLVPIGQSPTPPATP